MKNHYKFLLLFLVACSACNKASEQQVAAPKPETSEVESRAEHSEPQLSAPSKPKVDEFAVGKRLANPKTPTLSYDKIINRTAGSVKLKAYKKYKDKFDEYHGKRVNGTRGLIFEAAVAAKANDHLERSGQNERFLITGIEGDRSHPADVIRWKDGVIKKRYQLKSTWSRNDIAEFLDDDKYDGMVIVIHPEVLEEFKQRLRKQKQRGKPLDWEMEALDEAIESGRLSDSVIDDVPAPSYEEMHDKADQVIWQQIKAAQAQWE